MKIILLSLGFLCSSAFATTYDIQASVLTTQSNPPTNCNFDLEFISVDQLTADESLIRLIPVITTSIPALTADLPLEQAANVVIHDLPVGCTASSTYGVLEKDQGKFGNGSLFISLKGQTCGTIVSSINDGSMKTIALSWSGLPDGSSVEMHVTRPVQECK